MAKIDMIDNDNTRILRVQGALSIQDASVLRGCLLEALDTPERLLLDLTGAGTVDLACMQVLCSAHKTFTKAQKSISITGKLPEGIARSLSSVTIVPEACDIIPHGPCIWAIRGKDE